ncbi:MAG: hypothetical protein C0607_15075 [Azoarcus sp.]|nr:MAG: hypothetical protein C0607_15075 [Azoarcus sp.]
MITVSASNFAGPRFECVFDDIDIAEGGVTFSGILSIWRGSFGSSFRRRWVRRVMAAKLGFSSGQGYPFNACLIQFVQVMSVACIQVCKFT